MRDCLKDLENVAPGKFPKGKECLFALFGEQNSDFHWFRQDKNHRWLHKLGWG